jgi:hypothetical protein
MQESKNCVAKDFKDFKDLFQILINSTYISIQESPFKQVMLVLGETALLLTIYNFMSI